MSEVVNISHVKSLATKAGSYYIICGESSDAIPCWFIIRSSDMVMNNVPHGANEYADIENFGDILESGFGYEPPAHVCKEYFG